MDWVVIAGILLGLIPAIKFVIITGKVFVALITTAIIVGMFEVPFRYTGLFVTGILAVKILLITWGAAWLAWTYTPEFWETVRSPIIDFSLAVSIPTVCFAVWCTPLFDDDDL